MDQPLFEQRALATLDRCKQTFAGRGVEYGDTWRETRFLTMQAVSRALGIDINSEHFRALATAAFVDMKYWRLLGGYKDDSLIDGINYTAFLADEMRQLELQEIHESAAEANAVGPSGDWFQTYTGKQFYPLSPTPEMICIEDIAHALSRICRFGGHVNCEHYSVAQHSVLVASIVPDRFKFQALMHDAAEAYTGDNVRPRKKALSQLVEEEKRVWSVIAQKFNLPIELDPTIKIADTRMLLTEQRDLMGPPPADWSISPDDFPPMQKKIVPWCPTVAEAAFNSAFHLYSK